VPISFFELSSRDLEDRRDNAFDSKEEREGEEVFRYDSIPG